jgi:hypothetical protein
MKTIYIHNTLKLINSNRKYSQLVQELNQILSLGKGLVKNFNVDDEVLSYISIEDDEPDEETTNII